MLILGRSSCRDGEEAGLLGRFVNQAQDRANAICNGLYSATQQVAALLSENESITGEQVKAIVDAVKAQRSREAAPAVDPLQELENKQDA